MLVFIPVFDIDKRKDFPIQQGEVWCGEGALKSLCVWGGCAFVSHHLGIQWRLPTPMSPDF
jgi:hypothetical protein